MSESPSHSAETVQWRGSISHWHYAGRWLQVILLLAVLGATFFVPAVQSFDYLWPARGALALLGLILIFWIALDRRQRRYIITNHRVIVEFGLVSKQSNEIRVQDIRSINLTMTGLKAWFGIGRVEFSSAASDDAEVIFWNTPDAQKVRDLVRSLQS
jgi:uncharacterized membrane protein YdbT with pleckstrin-like domain